MLIGLFLRASARWLMRSLFVIGILTALYLGVQAFGIWGKRESARCRTLRSPNFTCPQCDAKYKRVRLRTPSGILPVCEFGDDRDGAMFCLICMKPLPPRDGALLLKYLLRSGPKGERSRSAPNKRECGCVWSPLPDRRLTPA